MQTARRWWSSALVVAAAWSGVACGSGDETGSLVGEAKEWKAPAEGSCEAKGMLAVANAASFEELDVEVSLDKRAAENIVAARPIDSVKELDAVSLVGASALNAILAYAKDEGHVEACSGGELGELGIVSDLDQTVIPKASPDLSLPAYPGVAALYQLIENRSDGKAGDVYYVTARTPDKVTEVPAYLEDNGVPEGRIETGTSGIPSIARKEKVKDHSTILDETGEQRFVIFGDTAHVDPEVHHDILAKYPDRIVASLIHKATATVSPDRVEGLHLHENYAQAAAILFGLGVLTRDEALDVMNAARDEGLEITKAEIEDLLDAQEP